MTRHVALVLIAASLLVAGACSPPPDDPAARATPVASMPTPMPPVFVHVQVPEEAGAESEAWAEALRAAVTAGHSDLKLTESPEEAAVVVRIDTVETGVKVDPEPEGEGETSVMRGALVLGEAPREFSLAYRGDVRPQAEALARNLRAYAAEAGGDESDAPEAPDAPEPEAETGE